MITESENLLAAATKRLAQFAIFFTALAFSIETSLHIISPNSRLILLEGTIAIINITLTGLLFFNRISTRKATIFLIYPVIANMAVVYLSSTNYVNVDSMILRDMLYTLLLVFLASYALNRIHNIIICILFTAIVVTVAFISQNEYLTTNLASILIILVGGWITVNSFAQLLNTTFQKYLKSQKKIVELNNYKHNLVSLIIHDLKVPVNSIIDLSNKTNDSILNRINNSATDLNRQITTILDVEKLENTKVQLNVSSIEIEYLIDQAIKGVEVLALGKNITINTQYKTSGYLKCNNEYTHRLMINLLSNAIKHSKANDSIKVEVESSHTGCFIKVIDFGKGIKEEHLSHIFDKFFNVQSDDFGSKSSSGLGLTFCKLAMQAHKGSIKVESEYGKGAEFTLFFPDYIASETNEHLTNSYYKTLQLNSTEKERLSQICFQLSSIEVYKISQIAMVLSPLQKNKNPRLTQWSEHILQAAYSGDVLRYNSLLKLVYETKFTQASQFVQLN